MKWQDMIGIKSVITQKELCDHIEDDDFRERYQSLVVVKADNGQELVCISWEQYQGWLRSVEEDRRRLEPGYDPEKLCEMTITIDEDLFNQVELICAQYGMTVAGATEEFFRWSVKHPDEVKRWVEECRASGVLEECKRKDE